MIVSRRPTRASYHTDYQHQSKTSQGRGDVDTTASELLARRAVSRSDGAGGPTPLLRSHADRRNWYVHDQCWMRKLCCSPTMGVCSGRGEPYGRRSGAARTSRVGRHARQVRGRRAHHTARLLYVHNEVSLCPLHLPTYSLRGWTDGTLRPV